MFGETRIRNVYLLRESCVDHTRRCSAGRFLGHLLGTPTVHQPTGTMTNGREYFQRQKSEFAGVFEQRRTATTSWI
jgi:hypothetical protein